MFSETSVNYNLNYLNPFGILITPSDTDTNKAELVSDIDLNNLKKLFTQHQIIILRGFEDFNSTDSFTEYCEQWGEVSLWPFGKVLELVEQEKPEDHIFDHSYVPMHWDGMYRPQVPEYQIFRCLKAPQTNQPLGQGGRTTFANSLLMLKNTPEEIRQLWEKITGIYQRKMEFYNSKTISPVITRHPYIADRKIIRYNEPPDNTHNFINPPNLEFTGVSAGELELFHKSIKSALYHDNNYYAHEWHDGDIVIADNFTLLHGRESFISQSPRHIQRVHVLSDPAYDNPHLVSHHE